MIAAHINSSSINNNTLIDSDILIHPSAQSERYHYEQEDRSDYSSILSNSLCSDKLTRLNTPCTNPSKEKYLKVIPKSTLRKKNDLPKSDLNLKTEKKINNETATESKESFFVHPQVTKKEYCATVTSERMYKTTPNENDCINTELSQLSEQNIRAAHPYKKMISVGVPLTAVIQKMKKDGIGDDTINSFNQHINAVNNSKDQNSIVNNTETLREINSQVILPITEIERNKTVDVEKRNQEVTQITKDDLKLDPVLSKYIKMASVGIPLSSVVGKMKIDNILGSKIDTFETVYDLRPSSQSNDKVLLKRLDVPAPIINDAPSRRSSVSMQKLHWKSVAKEKVNDSLWASFNHDETSDIDQTEIKQLENLFARSQSSRVPKRNKRNNIKKKEKIEIRLIELKRANNVAISLAQYRSFTNYDELCEAIITHDTSQLNEEKLQNMKALLPTGDEMKLMKNYKGGIKDLGRAELFFLAVSKLPRFSQKLDVFLFTTQFENLVLELENTLKTLWNACNEIMKNKKLSALLKHLLAVGNFMNEGAGTQKVSGITVDSLIKTARKKGSDGQTSVLDHVVGKMLSQGDIEGLAFWEDMPNISQACRISIKDSKVALDQLQNGDNKLCEIIEIEDIKEHHTGSATDIFLQKSRSFGLKAREKIKAVEYDLSRAKQSLHTLCSFFAEDSKTFQVR